MSLLFTDIKDSTQLWEQHPEWMGLALSVHDDIITESVQRHSGSVFKRLGDGLSSAFTTADDAVAAAVEAQARIRGEFGGKQPGLGVRMAVHTGAVDAWGTDYLGETVNRTARLMSLGHAGQILISGSTFQLVSSRPHLELCFSDLGHHRLRGLTIPENVIQVAHIAWQDTFPPLRDSTDLQGNLPEQLTSFVGRRDDLGKCSSRLEEARLVTIAGSGGIGKTRFALALASETQERFEDGTWFVQLERIENPDGVAGALARCLSVLPSSDGSYLDAIAEFLRSRNILIVLDNCEHVLPGVRQLCAHLLGANRLLHILTTSREVLGITGEVVFRLPPLSLPPAGGIESGKASPEEVSEVVASEAGRLFIDRVKAANANFELTPSGATAMRTIVRKLDGIPLAIELAAARCRSLSIEQLAVRLTGVFKVLTLGGTETPRHRTLEATMDWSFELLPEPEKALFCRLSAFSGGWSLEGAEAVCGFGPISTEEVLDVLTSLVDKSLVQTDDTSNSLRFKFLEPIRQYALEKREATGKDSKLKRLHFDFFASLAGKAKIGLRGPNQLDWLDLLAAEHDNIQAALQWGVRNTATNPRAARAVCDLSPFWIMRGHFAQAGSLLDEALRLKPGQLTADWIEVLVQAGAMRVYSGDSTGLDTIQDAFRAAENMEPQVRGNVLFWLGMMSHLMGDNESATTLLQRALALLENGGDPDAGGYILLNLGNLAFVRDDLDEARHLYQRCLNLRKERGDKRGVGAILFALGHVARTGCQDEAVALYREAVQNSYAVSDFYTLAGSLGSASFVLLAENQPLEAAKVQGFADALATRIQGKLDAIDQKALNWTIEATRTKTNDKAYKQAFDDGKLMRIEAVVELLCGSRRPPGASPEFWESLGE